MLEIKYDIWILFLLLNKITYINFMYKYYKLLRYQLLYKL